MASLRCFLSLFIALAVMVGSASGATVTGVTIDSPVNNFVATAPYSTTISATVTGSLITKVEFIASGALLGVSASPIAGVNTFAWSNVPTGTYVLTVRATDSGGATLTSAPVTVSVKGGIFRQRWDNIGGTDIGSLLSGTNNFANAASINDIRTSFDVPVNAADNYGTRMRGFLHVTAAGSNPYTFWVSSDDASELWLSTDTNPSLAAKIATVNGWTNPLEWNKEANQKSATITLAPGRYYIEARHKEGGGGDSVAAAWKPGAAATTTINNGDASISGTDLSPIEFVPTMTLTPTSASLALSGGTQSFTATVRDGFGAVLATQPTVTWTATGGTVSPNPASTTTYTSGNTGGSGYTVIATSGALTATAAVTIASSNLTVTISVPSPSYVAGQTIPITANIALTTPGVTVQKVEFLQSGLLLGLGTNTTGSQVFNLTNAAVGSYVLTARVTDNSTPTPSVVMSAPVTVAVGGGILREVWYGIGGTNVIDLVNGTNNFVNPPGSTNLATSFEAPSGLGDNYGQRMRGFLIPPTSGNYVFWIASDDSSELYLSTTTNPANKVLVAAVNGWTNSREWAKMGSQQSSNGTFTNFSATPGVITLSANQIYYIEARMKQGGGGDNLAVGWDAGTGAATAVIPGSALCPPSTAPYSLTLTPTTAALMTGSGTKTFTATIRDVFGVALSPQPVVNWSFTPANGSLSATTGASTTFTAGGSAGTVTITAACGSVSGTATVDIAPVNLTNSLVGLWALDGNANDTSSVPSPSTPTGLTYSTSAIIGSAGVFSPAANGRINVPTTAKLNSPTTGISIAAWVQASMWKEGNRIAEKNSAGNQYRLIVQGGQLTFQLGGVTGGTVTATLPSAGAWHHLCGTYDGGLIKLFIDGYQVASGAASGLIGTTASDLLLGSSDLASPGGAQYFSGLLDDIRIYSRAINPVEVATLATVPAPTVLSVSSSPNTIYGGTLVTITGTGFIGATTVSFGANAATDVAVLATDQLTCRSPAGTGTVNITVTCNGSSTAPFASFVYTNPGVLSPWTNNDIGGPGVAGGDDNFSGTFTQVGSGGDIWNTADQFNYTSQDLNGDGVIVARLRNFQTPDGWTKVGLMMRESTAGGAPYVMIEATGGNGFYMQRRTVLDGGSEAFGVGALMSAPSVWDGNNWMRLSRSGNNFTAATSTDGTVWTTVGTYAVTMASAIKIGMAVTSHNNGVRSRAVFSNVLVQPPPAPPSGLVATSLGGTNYQFTWTGPTDGRRYVLERADAATPTVFVSLNPPGVTVLTEFDSSGTSGQTYIYRVTATQNNLTSSPSNTVTVTLPPDVVSFTPLSGPVGTVVVISGNGFTSVGAVSFNGTPATQFTVNSATEITVKVPSGATDGPIGVTSGGLTGFSGSSFTVSGVSGANKLAFIDQPVLATAAGATIVGQISGTSVAVEVRDAGGAVVSNANNYVTLAIASGPGGAILSGTVTVQASGGVASFSNLSINLANNGSIPRYTLIASSPYLNNSAPEATSVLFDITGASATPTQVVITPNPPASVVAGATITPPITAEIRDVNGRVVTSATTPVTLTLTTPAGATLSGTTTVNAVGGIATFSGLSIDKVGSYTLTATNGALISAPSSSIAVTVGAPARLAFIQQPTNTLAGSAIAPAVTVRITDASGNSTAATNAVTLSLGSNPGNTSLTGITTVTAVAGVATFDQLSLGTIGTGYTLVANGNGLSSTTSSSFNVTANVAAKLVFSTQPSTTSANGTITPAVVAEVQDLYGNRVTSASGSVALTIGTNPASGTLTGGGATALSGGIATFAALSINNIGTGYTLVATGSGGISSLPTVTSNAFDISAAGPPSKLAFTVQPATTVAGVTMANVSIAVQDVNGVTVPSATNSITIAFGANPGSATLGGTKTVSAVAGVATFSTLAITTAATGYTFTAAATGLTGATSTSFDITGATPTTLVFTTQPVTSAAGATIPVVVTARDTYGNASTGFAGQVAIAFGTNPGGGSAVITGTSPVGAVNGVATFSLAVNVAASGYTFSASTTSPALAQASSSFSITVGSPAKLAFVSQPTDRVAGGTISPAVTVVVQDAQGNTVTSSTASVTVAIGTNPGGGVLSGTATVSAVAGIATFSTLSINKTGTGYTLGASSGVLTVATSAAFAITPGAANKLAFAAQPTTTVAGSAMSSVDVTVQDSLGNTVTSSTALVTLAIGTNPSGGTLSGTVAVTAVAGVASFSTLSINKTGTGYTLTAAGTSLTGATSSTFNITAGPAAQLAFTTQPVNTAAAATISPAVVVTVQDSLGNTVTSSTASIALAIGTNPGGGTLSGTTPVSAAAGVASFSNLSINKTGTGYTLSATSGGLTTATSTAFSITPGAATKLAFIQQPTQAAVTQPIVPAMTVEVRDANDNRVTTSSASITLSIGTNPPGTGVLSGTKVVSASAGLATFSGLSIDKVGVGYNLTAAATGLTGTTSSAFDIVAGAATQLAFSVQPTTTGAGGSITPAVQVEVRDALGNRVLTATTSITVAIGTNPGGGTLSGTTTVSAVAGVASFSGLSINATGTGYALTANGGSLTVATSSTFNITVGGADHLAFGVQPGDTVFAQNISPAVTVRILDVVGNLVTTATNTVTMAIGTNPASGTLSGTLSVAAVNGVATFSALAINNVGTAYTLSAGAGLPGGVVASSAFNIVGSGSPTKLAISALPASTQAGSTITSFTVTVQDSLSNTVAAATNSITLNFGANPGLGTLSGTVTVAATAGVATFNNISINKTGTGYTLVASSGSLASSTSNTFNITPGAGSALAFTVQPSAVIAGAVIAPAVQVAVRDALGNTVTTDSSTSITVAIGIDPNGAGASTLSGTKVVTVVSGVAVFSTLNINKTGAGFTLAATSSPVFTPTTSSAFTVTPGTATKVVFGQQPTAAVAGTAIAPAITATIQDVNSNIVTGSSATVTLAIGTNPAAGTLSGTSSVAAVSGVATFSGLSINRSSVSTYTLIASSTSLTSATSSGFLISAGASSQLVFSQQPSNAQAAVGISPAITVTVQDSLGNTVTSATPSITLAIASNPGGGTLSGTATVAAVSGVATFPGMSINKTGVGYSLTADDVGPLSPITSNTFTITPGTATQVAFVSQPTNAVAGLAISPAVTVAVQDAQGNTVTSSTASVVMAIGTNPGGGSLSGTATVSAVSGIATFSTLSINKTGTGYTLGATSGALTAVASSPFNITPGAANHLGFVAQPVTTVAGSTLPSVTVAVQDSLDNTVTSSSASLAVAIGTNPGGGTLSGTVTVSAASGVATFSTLRINKSGTGYTLGVTSTGLTSATSNAFNINAGAASQVAFGVQPSNTVAGASITPAITVLVQDGLGNTVTSSTVSIVLAIGTNPGGGALSGTATVAATAGVATFSGLSINKTGTGYTLGATSSGLTSVGSTAFNITAAAATKLVFIQQPTQTAVTQLITPAITVEVRDANDNRVTTSSASIALAIGTNPGSGALSGTATIAATAGVATFSGLSINKTGIGYTLTAASSGLTGTTSSTFDIVAGVATQLAFSVQPVTTGAGAAITPAVQVEVRDALGNRVTTATTSLTVAIGTNPGSGTLSGTMTVSAVAGVATFSTLSINATGTGYTLTANGGSLTAATSSAFNITVGAAHHLAFTSQPSDVEATATLGSLAVTIQDLFNNTVTSATTSITLAIGTNPGSPPGVLSGTATVSAVAGVATFPGLSIGGLTSTGTGYTLTANGGSLIAATSIAFNVVAPGAPTQLAFVAQPSNAVAGVAIAPAITVELRSSGGILVNTATNNVTIAIGTNPGSGTLSGTMTVAAVAGVATFSTLSIDKAANGYRLLATSGSLASATSNTFNITPAAAASLAFIQGPSTVASGVAMSPAVTVALRDAFGNVATSSSANIGLAIGGGPGASSFSGGGAVATVNGVATFAALTITPSGTGYTLTASNGVLPTVISGAFQVTSNPPVLNAFNPTSGSVGNTVIITGNFLLGATQLTFSGVPAITFSVTSSTQIVATIPAGATTGLVSVTTPSGTGTSAIAFTVTAGGAGAGGGGSSGRHCGFGGGLGALALVLFALLARLGLATGDRRRRP